MRWHDHNFQAVYLLEFVGFGVRSTRHPGQFVEQSEVILVGNGGERLILQLDRNAFFRFDGLMQAFGPAPPWHCAASELVNDHDLPIFDHVIDIPTE